MNWSLIQKSGNCSIAVAKNHVEIFVAENVLALLVHVFFVFSVSS